MSFKTQNTPSSFFHIHPCIVLGDFNANYQQLKGCILFQINLQQVHLSQYFHLVVISNTLPSIRSLDLNQLTKKKNQRMRCKNCVQIQLSVNGSKINSSKYFLEVIGRQKRAYNRTFEFEFSTF